MASKEKKVRREDKSAAAAYFKKASDNYDQMIAAFHASNWNAAATLAVQCAISSADAICVHENGVRSISQDHLDVCDLVKQIPFNDAAEKAKQLRKIIIRKNMVQYEYRSVRKSDADEMVKVTARFYPDAGTPHLQMGGGRRSGRDSALRNFEDKGTGDFSPRGSISGQKKNYSNKELKDPSPKSQEPKSLWDLRPGTCDLEA